MCNVNQGRRGMLGDSHYYGYLCDSILCGRIVNMDNWERKPDEDLKKYRLRLEREVKYKITGESLRRVNEKESKIKHRWFDDIQKPLKKGDDKKIGQLDEKRENDLIRLYENALKNKAFRDGLPWGCRQLLGGVIVVILVVLYMLAFFG